MTPARPLVLATLALAAAGCASKAWIYEKPNVTPVHLDHDMAQCQRDATIPGGFSIFRGDRVNEKLFQSCMAKKGYTARQVGE